MIFADDMQAYVEQVRESTKGNIEQFLRSYSIDQIDLEGMVRRISDAAGAIFYVSTVARGLAGSKSDIDIIVIADSDQKSVSNMMFVGSRRIGVKLIGSKVIADSLKIIRDMIDEMDRKEPQAIDQAALNLPLSWHDLERIVNGFSFDLGMPYLTALPGLCTWVQATSISTYFNQRKAFLLAKRAELHAPAAVYFGAMITSAMEALMAACGRIQSNRTWTLQRWSAFAAGKLSPAVLRGTAIMDSALTKLRCGTIGTTDIVSLDEYMHELFGGVIDGQLKCPSHITTADFLPAATLYKDTKRAVVGPAVTLLTERRDSELSCESTAQFLSLFQKGMLCLSYQSEAP